ncbi:MAG: hypothetical protein KatS3mg031_2969 [Chitinophagales bacterium]|nr:MAG: hypothetical protein KatS3mg031_2969 [Chitinophagales bacterium]
MNLKNYEADHDYNDIWLVDYDKNQALVLKGGYHQIRQKAIDEVGYVDTTYNDDERCTEKCWEYDEEDVKQYIRDNMMEFLLINKNKLVYEQLD